MNDNFGTPINLPDFSNLDLNFDIIDAHHHLFDLDKVYYPWLRDEPEPNFLLGNYESLKHNYSPQDYLVDTGNLNVVKTIHVEAESDHNDPLRETRWLCQLMGTSNIPSAIVAHAWLHMPTCEKILEQQTQFTAVRGIRSKPITSRSADTKNTVYGKPCSMQDANWRNGLKLLRKYNLSWDLRVPYWHLIEAAEVCRLNRDLPIVLEHTGLSWDRSEAGLEEWRKGMSALADCNHVYLKISELGLAGAPWDYIANRQIVREAIELFGFERCMFASNFPVSGLRISYVEQAKAIAHMIKDCSSSERNALFHDTAKRFYRL